VCVCMQRLPVRVLKTLNVETLCSKYTTALTFRIPSAPYACAGSSTGSIENTFYACAGSSTGSIENTFYACAGSSTLNAATLCSKYTTALTFRIPSAPHICAGSSTLRAPRLGHAERGMIRDVGASKYLRARLV
jgi:hypothetical protein